MGPRQLAAEAADPGPPPQRTADETEDQFRQRFIAWQWAFAAFVNDPERQRRIREASSGANGTGIKIDTGDGPKPATAAQLVRTWRRVVAIQEKKRRVPIAHVPEHRERVARPRERRAARRRRAPARGDPSEPDLAEPLPGVPV